MKLKELIKKIETISNKFDIDSDCLYKQIDLRNHNLYLDIDYQIIDTDNHARIKLVFKYLK